MNRKYGWKRDRIDENFITLQIVEQTDLPERVILNGLPPIDDQESIGSCTANALGAAFEYEQIKQGLDDFKPSRLFLYYQERLLEGTTSIDNGAAISDGIKVLNQYGICPESDWPYDIQKIYQKPSEKAYEDAKKHKIISYRRVNPNLNDLKTVLTLELPVTFGFTVSESFETIDSSGIMPIPARHEKVLGGHAVVACGYDDSKQCIKVRNSWGSSWGDNGYFWMPYKFFNRENCNDCWVITSNIDIDKKVKLFSSVGTFETIKNMFFTKKSENTYVEQLKDITRRLENQINCLISEKDDMKNSEHSELKISRMFTILQKIISDLENNT